MGWPAVDIAFSKQPVAFILTQSNELVPYKIKNPKSGVFVIKDLGIFQMDPQHAIRSGKQAIYFFDARSPKPIDIRYLKELHSFAKKNGLSKIKQKDVLHSRDLRKFFKREEMINNAEKTVSSLKNALANASIKKLNPKEIMANARLKLIKQEEDKKKNINEAIVALDQQIENDNQERIKVKQDPLYYNDEQYTSWILDDLMKKGLITQSQFVTLKHDIVSGAVSVPEFIRKLHDMNAVEIHDTLPMASDLWLEDFNSYDPSKVMAYIKMTRNLSKAIEKLGEKKITNLIPAGWVIMIVLAIVFGAGFIASVGWETFANLIPSF